MTGNNMEKKQINSKKEAFNFFYPNDRLWSIKIDRRKKGMKAALSFISKNELDEINEKKYHRYCYREFHYSYQPFKDLMKNVEEERRSSRNYQKVLIEGGSHIWWASPDYCHEDYNKSSWRKKTPRNMKEAVLINRLILGGKEILANEISEVIK